MINSMETDPSPQTPPSLPPPMPLTGWMEPPAVKAFGVIHLVFAGFGCLMGVWGLVAPFISDKFVRAGTPGYQAQISYQHEMRWATWMNTSFTLIVTALLVIAGLKLVRSQPDGVKWSNRYAWTSIITKLLSLVITVSWILPATQRMMGETMKSTGLHGKQEETMMTVMKGFMAAGTIAGPLVMCIYPGLALYLLSRPAVKEWRAARMAS